MAIEKIEKGDGTTIETFSNEDRSGNFVAGLFTGTLAWFTDVGVDKEQGVKITDSDGNVTKIHTSSDEEAKSILRDIATNGLKK